MAALALPFVPLLARLAAQQPQFKAGVDLVQIDVVALDKDGHPIKGLTAADFTLLDRNVPQSISTFKEVTIPSSDDARTTGPAAHGNPPVKMDVVSNQSPPADRLVAIVLDDLHTFSGLSDRVKDIARKVTTALAPQSSMAVLFTSGHHNVEFSRDAADVFAAIDSFTGASKMRRPTPGSDTGPIEAKPGSRPPAYREEQDGQLFFNDQTLLKTIGDAGRMLLTTPSTRRAFVLFSEGTANDLLGMFQTKDTPCDLARRKSCFYQDSLLEAMKSLERVNVTLYIFDPRGAVRDEDVPYQCLPGVLGPPRPDPCVGELVTAPDNWIRNAQHGLDIAAAAAGGFAVTNTDDFDGGIQRLLSEIDHYYLLGFSPVDRSGSGFRPIEVRVNRPGVTLHYRQGYVLGRPEKKPDSVDPLVALSSDVLPRTDLPLRLTAAPVAVVPSASAGNTAVRVLALGEGLLPAHLGVHDLKYTLLAADLDSGKVAASVSQTVILPSNTVRAPADLERRTVELPIEFALQPGRYQLRVSVLSPGIEKGGSVYLITEVPAFRPAVMALGGLLLGSARTTVPSLPQGVSVPALPFVPTLERTFDRTDDLRLFCPVLNPPEGPSTDTVEILDSAARVLVETSTARQPGDRRPILATVALTNLTPGSYLLRVTLKDTQRTAQRDIPIGVK